MKLLLVSAFTGHSGSAIRFTNIAVQLRRLGHTVVYVERDSPQVDLGPLPDGIPTHRCPVTRNLVLDMVLSTCFNLWMLLRNLDSDIYYALKPGPNNCFPAMVARFLGKRIFLDVDDLDYGYFQGGVKLAVSRVFFDGFPRFFEVITCHTVGLQRYLVDTLHIPGSRVHFLAQGVSEPFIKTPPVKTAPAKSVVYSATLGITSDLPEMLPLFSAVLRQHPDSVVKIIGDGVRRREFEALSAAAGIGDRMRFLGWVDHRDLPAVLSDNWVGVNYMRKSFHNDCRAILKIREYLARELPVVCNDVGDAGAFRDHVHIEPSLETMEKRVCQLLNEPWRPNAQGRLFVAQLYGWKKIVAEFNRERIVGPALSIGSK
jgi:glycosyltransferase involved in cell wall biosynthesis